MTSAQEPNGLIVCLPDAPLDDHVAVIETLLQEGLSRYALPAGSLHLSEVVGIFGCRAVFGAYRIATAEQVAGCAAAGMSFLLLDVADPDLIGRAAATQIPCFASAMTPAEVRGALDSGATGALIWPADVVGHAFGNRLSEVGLGDRVVPMGGIGAYAAGEWLKSGARAVCIEATLLGDAFDGGSLNQLRDRVGSFTSVQDRYSGAGSA